MQDFDIDLWYGLLAPARTPRPIIDRLNQEIAMALTQPELRESLIKQGLTPATSTPEQLTVLIRTDLVRWDIVVTQAKIKAD